MSPQEKGEKKETYMAADSKSGAQMLVHMINFLVLNGLKGYSDLQLVPLTRCDARTWCTCNMWWQQVRSAVEVHHSYNVSEAKPLQSLKPVKESL